LVRAGESFWERLPKLQISFGEILSRIHGNFEQQNGVLESFIMIIHYYHSLIIYFYCYCKFICREKERNKQLKAFLGSLFWLLLTASGLYKKSSLAALFGSHDK
jgi:hypothetical protein